MSSSIWFEEIDTALVKFIKAVVQIPDRQGGLVSIPVEVRKPDMDFKIETYPSVSIYNLYSVYEPVRHFDGRIKTNKDYANKKVTTKKYFIPYDMFYQIDFWSKTYTDMNAMTLKWLSKVERHFNLDVIDSGGNQVDIFALRKSDLQKSDIITQGQRVLHSFITYKFNASIDEDLGVVYPMITDVDIQIKQAINLQDKEVDFNGKG